MNPNLPPMHRLRLQELPQDAANEIVKTLIDGTEPANVCELRLYQLCLATRGSGQCDDPDDPIWRHACAKFGLGTLPVFPGGPPTWRATFRAFCDDMRGNFATSSLFDPGGREAATRQRDVQRVLQGDLSNPERDQLLVKLAYRGQPFLVQMLLAAGADANADTREGSPLTAASMEGHLAVVQILLAAGATVDAVPTGGAQWTGPPPVASTALEDASRNGHVAVVQALILAGADVNVRDGGPLSAASSGGAIDVVEALLAAGADVNAGNGPRRALTSASRSSNLAVVQRLLAAGADVNAGNGGALLAAVHPINDLGAEITRAIVEVLVAWGAAVPGPWALGRVGPELRADLRRWRTAYLWRRARVAARVRWVLTRWHEDSCAARYNLTKDDMEEEVADFNAALAAVLAPRV